MVQLLRKSLVYVVIVAAILSLVSSPILGASAKGNIAWAVQQGTWTIKGPHLVGGGVSAEVVSNKVYPSDRTFQVTMTTLSAGSSSWYVAWATGKYVSDCNRVILLIHTTGDVEFTYSSGCVSTFNVVYGTGLSPLVPHVFKMVFAGNNGKAFIDGIQYFDVTSPIIGAMGNTPVQLASWGPSQSSFENPTVF